MERSLQNGGWRFGLGRGRVLKFHIRRRKTPTYGTLIVHYGTAHVSPDAQNETKLGRGAWHMVQMCGDLLAEWRATRTGRAANLVLQVATSCRAAQRMAEAKARLQHLVRVLV